jgi:hypothetical protein
MEIGHSLELAQKKMMPPKWKTRGLWKELGYFKAVIHVDLRERKGFVLRSITTKLNTREDQCRKWK